MYRHVFGAVSAVSISFLSLPPTTAGGLADAFAAQNSVRAGFYLRLPFTGGLTAPAARDIDYGFAMSMNRSMTHDRLFAPRRDLRADIVKLNFTSRGFNTFSFVGTDIYGQHGWRLGANESSGGVDPAAYLIGGIAVIAGGLLLVDGDELHDRNLLPCPYAIRNGQCVIID